MYLDLNEAEDGGISWIAGSYANHLHLAPYSTSPAPHHSIYTSRMLFLMPNQTMLSKVDDFITS